MKTKIEDIPTLARWTEMGVNQDDNALNGYIKDLQGDICGLVAIEDYFAPAPGKEPSNEYTIINTCCRRLAILVTELKSMRHEIHAAILMEEAGLRTRKGGEE